MSIPLLCFPQHTAKYMCHSCNSIACSGAEWWPCRWHVKYLHILPLEVLFSYLYVTWNHQPSWYSATALANTLTTKLKSFFILASELFLIANTFSLTRCLYSNVKCNFTKYASMFRDKTTCAVYFLFVKWWVEPWIIFHPYWYMLCQPLQNVMHWNKDRWWNNHHIPLKCFTEANCLVCVMRVWL